MKERAMHAFTYAIEHASENILEYMKTSIRILNEHKTYILNSLEFSYSNSVIEDINNLIKVIKKIVLGYRSFI